MFSNKFIFIELENTVIWANGRKFLSWKILKLRFYSLSLSSHAPCISRPTQCRNTLFAIRISVTPKQHEIRIFKNFEIIYFTTLSKPKANLVQSKEVFASPERISGWVNTCIYVQSSYKFTNRRSSTNFIAITQKIQILKKRKNRDKNQTPNKRKMPNYRDKTLP